MSSIPRAWCSFLSQETNDFFQFEEYNAMSRLGEIERIK